MTLDNSCPRPLSMRTTKTKVLSRCRRVRPKSTKKNAPRAPEPIPSTTQCQTRTAYMPARSRARRTAPTRERISSAIMSKLMMMTGNEMTLLTCTSKFVDSHIKPFRCKREKCDDVKFSSTACLLRHERENHGMHGHGDRPHLCYYQDCDRSRSGHGFPRRYNAFDHMKRVHGWNPDNPNPSSPPREGAAPATRKVAGRKRKSTADDSAPKRKAKQAEPKPIEPSHQELLEVKRSQFHREFSNKKQIMIEMLGAVDNPNDLEKTIRDQLKRTMVELFEAASAHKQCSG
jgi:hypothetical protein